MPVKIVVGTNWGDEGKGRMVDYLAQEADVVVRYQGGSNAGHTVINQYGEFKLHLIPSGIFNKNAVNVVGPGCVINLESLVGEINSLRARGIEITPKNLKISDRATIAFPFHVAQDTFEEKRLADKSFGSTKQGIAPAYGDKVMKYGIQLGTMFHDDFLNSELSKVVEYKSQIFNALYKEPSLSFDSIKAWILEWGELVRPFVCDTIEYFKQAESENKTILLEAQLGSLRDVQFGIYPYTTSSCTLASYAPVGAGFWSKEPSQIIGVMKAFSTCVGEGPFTTEMENDEAKELRESSAEFGARTGRPRRIGHFDAVASKYGTKIQNATEVVLTKLDCLSGRKELKICTHYLINNQKTCVFPINPLLNIATPVYETLPGWNEDISTIRDFNELPENAKKYIRRIEELIETKLSYCSVGPERESLIKMS